MRILVSGRGIPGRHGWSNCECIARGFAALGHDVHLYGNMYGTDDPIDQYSPRTGTILPDLLVFTECNDNDAQYGELLELPCTKVFWDFDTSMHEGFSRWMFPQFDKSYVANPSYSEEATYLPYGVDETLFFPGEQYRDAAIIGNPFPERVEFAGKAGLEVVSGIYNEEYAEAVRSLKVQVHHHDSGGQGLLVSRVWETMASGVCLLTADSKSIRRHFTPRINVEVYDSPWECRQKVDDLLRNDERRELIARNGLAEILRGHTWTARARRILADMVV